MSHLQFSRDTRIELATLRAAGKITSACAQILGMNKSSISRELRQNQDSDGVYRGGHAHKRAQERRRQGKRKQRKIENDLELQVYIICELKRYWSPEQIAGRLKRECKQTIICHETIYSFLYGERPDLVGYLRHQKNKYRKRRGTRARMKLNHAMKVRRIDERPAIVETRKRVGDWEGDTIVGKEKTQRILTYVERKTGLGMADKLGEVTAQIVQHKTSARFKMLPKKVRHTLTRDNGAEFGDFDRDLECETGMFVYRAYPYHSWERGTNENWNGLLRQFFPKGMHFSTITQDQIDRAVRLLNTRPRKRLSYQTPRERFKECCDSD